MISCTLEVTEDVDNLHKIFLPENLNSDRINCEIIKNKYLTFNIKAKDPVAMKACLNSILKIIETHNKIK